MIATKIEKIFLITKFYINLVSIITKYSKIQGITRFTNYCRGRWGGRGCGRQMCATVVVVEIDGLDFDLQDDAVEQRARNLAHVVGALVLIADAFLLGMPVVSAWARIHARHKHERGGVFGAVLRSRN